MVDGDISIPQMQKLEPREVIHDPNSQTQNSKWRPKSWVLYMNVKPLWMLAWLCLCNHLCLICINRSHALSVHLTFSWLLVCFYFSTELWTVSYFGLFSKVWLKCHLIISVICLLFCNFIASFVTLCLSFPPCLQAPISPASLLSLCQWKQGCLYVNSATTVQSLVRSRSREEAGVQQEKNCSGSQGALGRNLAGPIFPCSFTHDPLHTEGPGTSQVPRAVSTRRCFTQPRACRRLSQAVLCSFREWPSSVRGLVFLFVLLTWGCLLNWSRPRKLIALILNNTHSTWQFPESVCRYK